MGDYSSKLDEAIGNIELSDITNDSTYTTKIGEVKRAVKDAFTEAGGKDDLLDGIKEDDYEIYNELADNAAKIDFLKKKFALPQQIYETGQYDCYKPGCKEGPITFSFKYLRFVLMIGASKVEDLTLSRVFPNKVQLPKSINCLA